MLLEILSLKEGARRLTSVGSFRFIKRFGFVVWTVINYNSR